MEAPEARMLLAFAPLSSAHAGEQIDCLCICRRRTGSCGGVEEEVAVLALPGAELLAGKDTLAVLAVADKDGGLDGSYEDAATLVVVDLNLSGKEVGGLGVWGGGSHIMLKR